MTDQVDIQKEEELQEQKMQEIYDLILHKNSKLSSLNSILSKTMIELVKSGHASFLFLRDDQVNNWWSKQVNDAVQSIDRRNKKIMTYLRQLSAWNKLTERERRILGLQKPVLEKYLIKYLPKSEDVQEEE